MDRALDLAERGRYTVSPNPMVGAVIVKAGRFLAEAYHRRAGGPHAEAAALSRAGARARGADLYLTLEPCAHFGRTPPCVERILTAGIRRVVMAARDPNPLVRGKGVARLARAGIKILWAGGQWQRRAERQNEKFRVWIRTRRPFVLAKWAATLDGRIATAQGESRWITGAAARRRALLLREEYDAVLVGAGTIAVDDPRLSRRLGRNRVTTLWRILLDEQLRVSERARVFRRPEGCVVATARPPNDPRALRLARRGVEIWSLPSRSGGVHLVALLERLARRSVTSVMVEGGGRTLASFFEAGLVDRVAAFVAPRILGGERAVSALEGKGFQLAKTPWLTDLEIKMLGKDWLVTGRVKKERRT